MVIFIIRFIPLNPSGRSTKVFGSFGANVGASLDFFSVLLFVLDIIFLIVDNILYFVELISIYLCRLWIFYFLPAIGFNSYSVLHQFLGISLKILALIVFVPIQLTVSYIISEHTPYNVVMFFFTYTVAIFLFVYSVMLKQGEKSIYWEDFANLFLPLSFCLYFFSFLESYVNVVDNPRINTRLYAPEDFLSKTIGNNLFIMANEKQITNYTWGEGLDIRPYEDSHRTGLAISSALRRRRLCRKLEQLTAYRPVTQKNSERLAYLHPHYLRDIFKMNSLKYYNKASTPLKFYRFYPLWHRNKMHYNFEHEYRHSVELTNAKRKAQKEWEHTWNYRTRTKKQSIAMRELMKNLPKNTEIPDPKFIKKFLYTDKPYPPKRINAFIFAPDGKFNENSSKWKEMQYRLTYWWNYGRPLFGDPTSEEYTRDKSYLRKGVRKAFKNRENAEIERYRVKPKKKR